MKTPVIIIICLLTLLFSCDNPTNKTQDKEVVNIDTVTAAVSNPYEVEAQLRLDSLKRLWTDTASLFPQASFAKVVGYTLNKGIVEEGNKEEHTIYDRDKHKFAKSKDRKAFVLSRQQTDTLISILNDTTTFTPGQSGCFIPHHAFVFYDKLDSPVAYINICFMCHRVSANPQTPIMLDGGLLGDGWKRLQSFCKNIGMSMAAETAIPTSIRMP